MSRRWLSAAILCAAASTASSLAAQPAQPKAPPAAPDGADLAQKFEAQQADINEQDARIKDLEKQLKELRAAIKAQESKAPPPSPPPSDKAAEGQKASAPTPAPAPAPTPELPELLRGFLFSGYVQGQYESHQDSEDQLRQGGVLLNQDRFVLRRARLKVEKDWEYARIMAEIDGNTVKGPAIGLQHAEASILYRGSKPAPAPPLIQVTIGLFDVPFGAELVESPKTRYFMERSLASRSFFPSEPDLGLRVTSSLGWLRLAVAAMNGEPLGEKSGLGLRDPNAGKDLAARVGVDVSPTPSFNITGGVSVLNGRGFHPGTDPTKASVVWKDANENGQIDTGEITAVPAVAATPSMTWKRWAVGADLRLALKTPIGTTELKGELSIASNMDRGLVVADPILTAIDLREIGYSIGVTQEIMKYGVIGFRFDSYDPNADSQDRQGGKLIPTSQTIRTFSPMAGLVLPDRARLLFQYDVQRDFLGRTPTGVPADLKNDAWTLRLQVQM